MKINKVFEFLIYIICILILGHQLFWCPIHGDGAFYSLVLKQFVQNPTLKLYRATGEPFFDHPYLFFYLSWPIVKLFGFSDLAIKLPNLLIAFVTLYFIVLTVKVTMPNLEIQNADDAHIYSKWSGLLACLFLVLMAGYEMQIRQPSLDPLAHLFALMSLYVSLRSGQALLSGVILGLAFLAKGTEMLPHLGALLFINMIDASIKITISRFYINIQKALLTVVGLVCVVALWFGLDMLLEIGWFKGYYSYQFSGRFLNHQNFEKKFFDFSFIKVLFSVFQPWFFLMFGLSIYYFRKIKKIPLLWIYVWIYIFLVSIAFSIIKKDSSQHYTGIYILGAILLGQASTWFYSLGKILIQKKIIKYGRAFLIFLFVCSFVGTVYFWITPYNKKDLWGAILDARSTLGLSPKKVVVIDPSDVWQEQIYWTGRWYWKNPIIWFNNDQRIQLQLGQSVYWVSTDSDGRRLNIREETIQQEHLNIKK